MLIDKKTGGILKIRTAECNGEVTRENTLQNYLRHGAELKGVLNMQFLTFPKLATDDEHIFYVLEGATLQVFGEASYPVFVETSREFLMHSLAHTAVNDFVVYGITETAKEKDYPTPEWTKAEQRAVMLQALCVRRCLFVPILETLNDTCASMLVGAVEEHRDSDKECLFRDAIQATLNLRFKELAGDDSYAPYLEMSEMLYALQVRNMHRTFRHCEAFAVRSGTKSVVAAHANTQTLSNYLVTQFPFLTTIVQDYLTRELPTEAYHAYGHTAVV